MSRAAVHLDGEEIAAIGRGILALIGVERDDSDAEAVRLAQKIATYRIFPDAAGKMNLSLKDTAGELLAVPQFTLVADTGSGTRPSFSRGASPEEGRRMFEAFMAATRPLVKTSAGRFGAHMQVSLVNDGPVTFSLRAAPKENRGQSPISGDA